MGENRRELTDRDRQRGPSKFGSDSKRPERFNRDKPTKFDSGRFRRWDDGEKNEGSSNRPDGEEDDGENEKGEEERERKLPKHVKERYDQQKEEDILAICESFLIFLIPSTDEDIWNKRLHDNI